MNSMPYARIIVAFWIIASAYWVIAARGGKADVSRQALPLQLLSSGGFVVGAWLLIAKSGWGSWLGSRLYAPSVASGVVGCLLAGCGLVVAITARRALGSNWSRVVARKENHELVVTGPYRYVRHPIYSGLLLMVVGTAVAIGEVRGVVAFVFVLASALFRVHAEDGLMALTFGDAYAGYRRRTKALIPWVV